MKATAENLQKTSFKPRVKNPPVLLLGGSANALSVARHLAKQGIEVYASVGEGTQASFSNAVKTCIPVPKGENRGAFWLDLLRGKKGFDVRGSVVMPCNDEAVEFVALHRREFEQDFIFDDARPDLLLNMLDKKKTLALAREAGIHTPNYWQIDKIGDLQRFEHEITFPVIIKPIHSHLFHKHFDVKLFYAHSPDELRQRLQQVFERGVEVMVTEWVPGPDSLLGSYYTYIDGEGRELFHFTKKVIRRFPVNQGLGCYHVTAWDEEIAEAGLKFFRNLGFRGMGNIEFKRDLRDGHLKIIECNPRFTAAQELITRSGMDMPLIIYRHLTGQPLPNTTAYTQGLHYWYPVRDFRAFLQLRKRKELTFLAWLRSISRRQVFPYFKFSDPMPFLVPLWRDIKSKVGLKNSPLEGG